MSEQQEMDNIDSAIAITESNKSKNKLKSMIDLKLASKNSSPVLSAIAEIDNMSQEIADLLDRIYIKGVEVKKEIGDANYLFEFTASPKFVNMISKVNLIQSKASPITQEEMLLKLYKQ